MAVRYLSPTGWVVNITVDLGRAFLWRSREGNETPVDREAVRAFIATKRTLLGAELARPDDNLQPGERIHTVSERGDQSGYYRYIGPDRFTVRRERERRAEANRRLKAARAERAAIRRECEPLRGGLTPKSSGGRL